MAAIRNITLTNHNPHSNNRAVTVNITTGRCAFADGREVELKQFITGSDFAHPLLREPFTEASDNVYHYEYDDIDGLLYSAIYVCTILLHADKPRSCQFKINPSPAFQSIRFAQRIDLSIYGHKAAAESIQIGQLEAMLSQIMGYQVTFSEDYSIETTFTIDDLPVSVNGDALYHVDIKLVELLKTPNDFNHYELRYINPRIGFGVFSKKEIKKGDIISFYTGIKTHQLISSKNYAFSSNRDCLNLDLDARQHGNIARFINHAPSLEKSKVTSSTESLLAANIEAVHHYLNGLFLIAYTATETIVPGEQLLVDYGELYFQQFPLFRFKFNGQCIDAKQKILRSHSSQKINHLRIMANHGVKRAQVYLALRMAGILAVVSLLIGMLHY